MKKYGSLVYIIIPGSTCQSAATFRILSAPKASPFLANVSLRVRNLQILLHDDSALDDDSAAVVLALDDDPADASIIIDLTASRDLIGYDEMREDSTTHFIGCCIASGDDSGDTRVALAMPAAGLKKVSSLVSLISSESSLKGAEESAGLSDETLCARIDNEIGTITVSTSCNAARNWEWSPRRYDW